MRWWNSVTISQQPLFLQPLQPKGTMKDQHFLRITAFLPSPSWASVREHLHRRRQSSDWKQERAKKHRKHVVLLGGLTQLQEGPVEKALRQPAKCFSRCPLVHVCAAPPGRNCTPGAGEVVILPPFGPPWGEGQGKILTLCLRLGLLSISFLGQIFVDFLLCPHPSSLSCPGRQA